MVSTILYRYKMAQVATHSTLTLFRSTRMTKLSLTERSRQERLKALMQKQSFEAANHGTVVKLDSILTTSTSSNLEHTICDLHDILKSYYKVARKRFVDVVCMQAADFHLVTGPATPVRLFSPVFVSQLKEEQLERIAGEDVSTRRHRAELRREIENLENGKKILI